MPYPNASDALAGLCAEWSAPAENAETLAARLAELRQYGLDRLPLPGRGDTLARWRMLASVAGCDLALVKLFESHTDALAIIAETSDPSRHPDDATWAVWAAEPPFARLEIALDPTTPERATATTVGPGRTAPALTDRQRVRLNGTKAWCSGAATVSHALVTASYDEAPYLAAVALDAPGVHVTRAGWHAVGMAVTQSVDVRFDDVDAVIVGTARSYLERPGFWYGGIGVAACWWGAAVRLGQCLHASAGRRGEPHALAHLGAVDVALRHGQARLEAAAAWIDAHPRADAYYETLSVRAAIDGVVAEVIHHVGRGVGAGPYCRDPAFARLIADLPVFVRQCHAERDLEALGAYRAEQDTTAWALGQPASFRHYGKVQP
ncbi:acyl-CoA dehydrogenase family protein [Salinicola halophilus]|uniref:acyl-CoA dehydrogenase family protein n=1 Tax=Salinicola halophilus TaxID=184065 RepID=UPI000DA23E36|nr:acyl-CoA dehydrogenase family protein [Salinicola halophilus]